ncbi:MAG: YidC/Oxa1 family membrane protein insertase, partial [Ruminococcaceae bacterium]|nr:YidC/Oxa1 family membrane protein insertase [Oscillospiraceae bacterium]
MSALFGLIATPLGYVMEYIYKFMGNYGYSIIAFALLAKFIMLPLSIKQKRSMITTQRLQPKLAELQKKYSNDREKYAEEAQRLYDDYGASPMGGCGTSLLTLPIMLGLYYVVTQPLTYMMHLSGTEVSALAEAMDVATNRFGYQLSLAGMFADNFAKLSAICDKIFPIDFTFYGFDLTATPSL